MKRWVGLTGTPSSNGLMDLWAEIGILDGGERLGKFIGRYREAYFKAASMNPSSGVVFQYKPKEGAEELIYQRISDITISMKALDYLNMPDCIPTRYEVEMNTEERKLYDMLKQDLLIPLKDGDIDAANAASLTGKLLQMSNGAVYDENGKARVLHDHKLEALEDSKLPTASRCWWLTGSSMTGSASSTIWKSSRSPCGTSRPVVTSRTGTPEGCRLP